MVYRLASLDKIKIELLHGDVSALREAQHFSGLQILRLTAQAPHSRGVGCRER